MTKQDKGAIIKVREFIAKRLHGGDGQLTFYQINENKETLRVLKRLDDEVINAGLYMAKNYAKEKRTDGHNDMINSELAKILNDGLRK